MSIINLKFLSYCFEWLTGLKINYHKSEVLVLGVTTEEQLRVANMLNCQVGKLPMTYLGIPILDVPIDIRGIRKIIDKMGNKLQPRKGKNMTSGGRLILTNTSLSNLPIFRMGMYKLKEGVHQQMDSIRTKFFGQGASDKSKYDMVKWENMCIPKDYGGLGIMNTRVMNEALVGKWVWRMIKANKDDLCYNLLK